MSKVSRLAILLLVGTLAFPQFGMADDQKMDPKEKKETTEKSEKEVKKEAEATEPVQLDEVIVTADKIAPALPMSASHLDEKSILRSRAFTSDTARMLEGQSGVSLQSAGGVSALPAIHGMADDRIRTTIDGMEITSACGNHMNPPLSYINPAQVEYLGVIAGITPVSVGGDSIAGTIEVRSADPEFAAPGEELLTHGNLTAFARTNGKHTGGDIGASAATENFSLLFNGSRSWSGDYWDGNGRKVKSTSFGAENQILNLAARNGGNLFSLRLGRQHIFHQDFANAHMDMLGNQAEFINGQYEGVFAWGKLDAKAYWQDTRHQMNVRGDKTPGMDMPMETEGTNGGYSIKAEMDLSSRNTLRVGNEFAHFDLDDWWPPSPAQARSACNTGNVNTSTCSMAPGTLWNINNGRRNRVGSFAEWETDWNKQWTSLIGLRNDVVWMNADDVIGYNMNPAATNYSAYYLDAIAFNARDHARTDVNFDVTALARYEPTQTQTYEAGYARKSRAPNLYERYLWIKRSSMSIRMNSWAGDANGYTGDLDLQSEIANTLSATADFHDTARKKWTLRLTPYFTYVQDYIDAIRQPVLTGGNGATAANLSSTAGLVNLQFTNRDARLYGLDLSGRTSLGSFETAGSFALSGVLNFVRGESMDTGDNLYHIMPVNGRLTLEHELEKWSNTLEFDLVDSKDEVSAVRNKLKTVDYGLFNLRSAYQWKYVRVDAGIENMFNKFHNPPLGGVHWIQDKTGGTAVPGMGRSVYGNLTLSF
ncbi:MAG: TonB-dependent receptor plug domain-containing protein [Candidatus Omnitrophica bacterium]|nr:TonB-dependent receptor plug domain-containing protein [Candidatus Omnitrophota bacterium]